MLGAGFLGSILGLQGGILFWLVQYMTGETVEERWHREYLHIQNTIRAKHQANIHMLIEIQDQFFLGPFFLVFFFSR